MIVGATATPPTLPVTSGACHSLGGSSSASSRLALDAVGQHQHEANQNLSYSSVSLSTPLALADGLASSKSRSVSMSIHSPPTSSTGVPSAVFPAADLQSQCRRLSRSEIFLILCLPNGLDLCATCPNKLHGGHGLLVAISAI